MGGCGHIHTYTRTYIHTYIHAYTCTYIHIHIHTYIHTYIPVNMSPVDFNCYWVLVTKARGQEVNNAKIRGQAGTLVSSKCLRACLELLRPQETLLHSRHA